METAISKVLITGGTGFIGTALAEQLLSRGVAVTVLTRDRHRAVTHFGGRVRTVESLFDLRPAQAPDVIVNLAGKDLGSARWNAEVKRQLVDSRVKTTRHVIDYIARADSRPQLLISGSAVGYYGARGEETLTEDAPPADEFQSQLCREWETMARPAEDYGVRLCISRTGVVLGRGGGALMGLAPRFRTGLGASLGSGQQCRTPDIAPYSMRLDRLVDEPQVGARVLQLLDIEMVAKGDEGLLRAVVGHRVEPHAQLVTFVIRDDVARKLEYGLEKGTNLVVMAREERFDQARETAFAAVGHDLDELGEGLALGFVMHDRVGILNCS
jgi:putative NADH-flavin reductase